MLDDTLEKMLALAEEQARLVMIGKSQDLMPTWVLVAADDEVFILGTPWRDDREKRATELFLRKEVRKRRTVAYSFITEAWEAHYPKETDLDKPLPLRPAQRPDRKEIVMAMATDGRRRLWRKWETRRDYTERVIALERADFGAGAGEPEGWMAELLRD
jgi:hypothetical protein